MSATGVVIRDLSDIVDPAICLIEASMDFVQLGRSETSRCPSTDATRTPPASISIGQIKNPSLAFLSRDPIKNTIDSIS
jgi:hypothetical protein